MRPGTTLASQRLRAASAAQRLSARPAPRTATLWLSTAARARTRARALTLELSLAGGPPLLVLALHRPYASSGHAPAERAFIAAWQAAFDAHVALLLARSPLVVVCGDFNACLQGDSPEERRIFAPLTSRRFADALAGTSEAGWPTQYPASSRFAFLRIDYIFVSEALRGRVVPGSGRVLSQGAPRGDHVPVEITLAF